MKCRLYKNEPTSAQRKALKSECVKEFNELLNRYNHQVAAQILYILRFDYGFGQERLEKFADKLKQMQIDLEDKYEMGEDCTWWLCEQKLIESGIDVKELLK
nr:MAG TPA: hypothetical protein [Caudoviricetes sp.]